MTPEEAVKEIAEGGGFTEEELDDLLNKFTEVMTEGFVRGKRRGAQDERERCAKIAESGDVGQQDGSVVRIGKAIAAKIRE